MAQIAVTVSARLPVERARALEEMGRERGLTRGDGETNFSATINELIREAMEQHHADHAAREEADGVGLDALEDEREGVNVRTA